MTTTAMRLKRPSLTGLITLVILAALALLGVGTGIYRLFVGLGATTDLSDAYPWGLWIGFDFALIAFSGGAFTLCGLIVVFNQVHCKAMERLVVLTGWLGYVSVLVILLVDLGRPDRFYNFLIYFNHHSPLFEVCWCILLYSLVLTLEFAPAVFEGLRRPKIAHAIHNFSVPIAIVGVTLSLMHQSTLGTLYLAMPHKLHTLWHSAMLPLFFLVSSIGMGMSTVILSGLVGHRAMGKTLTEEAKGVLRSMAKASVFVWAVYLLLKVEDLAVAGQLGAVFSFDAQSVWFLAELLIGVVLPIVLFALPRVQKSERGLLGTALLVTMGTVLNRFNTVLVGQKVVEGASYSPHWMEIAVQVGVLAAVILVWYLAASLLPIFEDDRRMLEAEHPEILEGTASAEAH
jgi:Ni/Fe-hydrogenase subunit HybB-like protein